MRKALVCAATLLALTAIPAWADWSDNFDSYTLGTINGQGGWHGWGAVPGAAGTVTNEISLSAPNSQKIAAGTDSVHEYTGYTSGTWTMSAMQYIQQPLVGGKTYFI